MEVKEVNNYIKRLIEFDPIMNQIFVVGEVSNFKKHSSGHLYFSLKDSTSKISCVMFRSNAVSLENLPQDGEKIEVSGRVGVYDAAGTYQIYVEKLAPVGAGDLYKAFIALKQELSQNGYFEKAAPILQLPKRIGIVTSPTGAAIRDIITVLTRRNPHVEVLIFPVHVQGANAAREIARAIDYFNETNEVDTIIVSRGGGSLEELWAFNELVVAEAIYSSTIPIISGVGHETDFTISDFVADLRAATPSEAAELAVISLDTIKVRLEDYLRRIIRNISNRIETSNLKLEVLSERVLCQLIRKRLDNSKELVEDMMAHHLSEFKNYKYMLENKVDSLGLVLNSVSPLNTISRGYSIVQRENQIITDIDQVDVSDRIDILLKNGIIKTEVISKERKLLTDE